MAAALDQRRGVQLLYGWAVGAFLIGAVEIPGTGDADAVAYACSALRREYIVVAVLVQHVGALCLDAAVPLPDGLRLGDGGGQVLIELQQAHAGVEQHVVPPVLVEEGGVYALDIDPDRSGVRPLGLFAADYGLAVSVLVGVVAAQGDRDIVPFAVVGYIRRPVAAAALLIGEPALVLVHDRIAYRGPVHQVA